MRLCSTPVSHRCDILSVEDLSIATGLTMTELTIALRHYVKTPRHAVICRRMLADYLEPQIVDRMGSDLSRKVRSAIGRGFSRSAA
jgi:hypothetical protein